MTSPEYTEYDRLTKNMEADFLILGDSFLTYVEEIIFGNDVKDFKYYCFHIFNDAYLKGIYTKLSYRIVKLINKTDSRKYPNLFDGFSNLLIYLKEPILRENDKEYKNANIKYWRDMVASDEVLRGNGSFRKYLRLQ